MKVHTPSSFTLYVLKEKQQGREQENTKRESKENENEKKVQETGRKEMIFRYLSAF